MAIKLSNKPNTVAIDAEYPYGDIRNVVGATPGTPVSREVYADFHQFFERLMADTNTTHNNLPDNATNDFQLFEALISWQKLRFESYNFSVFNDFFVECTNITGFKYSYAVTTQGLTEIDGSNDDTTFDLASLSKDVPNGHVHRFKIKSNLTGTFNFRILLNATGLGAFPPLIKEGVTAPDSEFVYTVDAIITFVKTTDGWQIV